MLTPDQLYILGI